MDVSRLIKSSPGLLKDGIQIYESLIVDMQATLGLRQHAENLSHITQVLKEAERFLDGKEPAEKFDEAYSLLLKGVDRATVVVAVMLEQSNVLSGVLSESDSDAKHEIMWAACQYFSRFAQDMTGEVNEAKDTLRNASTMLYSTGFDIIDIERKLEWVQEEFVIEKSRAEAENRPVKYGGDVVGLLNGPLGHMLSFSVPGVTKDLSISEIKENFVKQRTKISEYNDGFERLNQSTKDLYKRIATKQKRLMEIHRELSNASRLTEEHNADIRSIPLSSFKFIRSRADGLVKSCEEFLQSARDLA